MTKHTVSQPAERSLVILTCLALALATCLVFWQVHNFGFVNYDDNAYVYENPHVLAGLTHDDIVWAFTSVHSYNWHPLTWLSHMLDCNILGPYPGRMHLVNLLLHIANALMLFAILRWMTGALWKSAFVAAAFALHPMHVESVAWIAERKDVLSTFFLLLTVAAYVSYAKRPSVMKYFGTLILFAFGLMAKPMLVTLPFLLLLLDYWPLGRLGWRQVREKVPFMVLSAASSVVTFVVQQSTGAVASADELPLAIRVANACLSYVRYIGKAFWPTDLAPLYPLDVHAIHAWQVGVCIVVLLAASLLVIRLGRSHKYLPVGWFWFVGALVPVIGLVQVGRQALADRYTYVPYIGLFIVVAWGLPALIAKLPQRRFVLGLAAAIVLTVLGILAHRQASFWDNNVHLYSHTIDVTQNNDVAYNNRAVALNELGQYREAAADCIEAVRIAPDNADAYNNLGLAYDGLGRWQDALDAYEKAVKFRPDFAEAYNNLRAACSKLGHLQEAEGAFRRAVKARPDFAEGYSNLGNVFLQYGRRQEAMDQYRLAVRFRPDWYYPANSLAWLLATGSAGRSGSGAEAIDLAQRACQLTGYKDAGVLDTLAAAYASAGRFGDAVNTAQKALGLAQASSRPELRQAIQYHLSLYRQDKPYVEPAAEAASK